MLGRWLDIEDDLFLAWSKSMASGNGLSAHGERRLSTGMGGTVFDFREFSDKSGSAVCGLVGESWKPEEDGGLSRPALLAAGMLEKRERSWLSSGGRKGSSPGLEGPKEKERRPIDNLGALCSAC
jgi:hypothetical protein